MTRKDPQHSRATGDVSRQRDLKTSGHELCLTHLPQSPASLSSGLLAQIPLHVALLLCLTVKKYTQLFFLCLFKNNYRINIWRSVIFSLNNNKKSWEKVVGC